MKKTLIIALLALFASASAAWACGMGSHTVMTPIPEEETQSAAADGYTGS